MVKRNPLFPLSILIIFRPLQFSSMMGNRHQMLLLLCSFLLLAAVRTEAQDSQPNITGYTCSNPSPCDTYVFYRAQAPDFLNLINISDLFAAQRFKIAEASNLAPDTVSINDGQPLLVPITCGCMKNYSQANISYTIFKDDTYYLVSTRKFENLTTYQAVEVANPTLVPTDLQIGVSVIFPIRCKCPSKAQGTKGANKLITYVVYPGDTLSSVSQKFGADLQNLKSLNGVNSTLDPYTTILIPVSKRPELVQAPSSSPPASALPPPAPSPTNAVNNSTSSGGGSHAGVIIGASLGGVVALICIVFFIFWILRRRGQSSKKTMHEDPKLPSDLRIESFGRVNTKNSLVTSFPDYIDKLVPYSLEDLQKATQNFSPLCNIEGSVYRGTIHGKDCAIKLIRGDMSQELKVLQKVSHTNLVKLEGICISPEGQSYLVYEYVENGSLNSWLHDAEFIQTKNDSSVSSPLLKWKTRLQIAVDIANGLQYIHEHTNPSVVHKDIKSSNILLEGKFRAKIANFGMAKSGINALTKHIVGTQGYMAPEYLADGLVSSKLDVFAFGVVLLELISGKEAIVREGGLPLAGREGLLWTHIKPLLEGEGEDREEKVRQWVDGNLQNAYSIDSVLGLATIARACVEEDPGDRPPVGEIVYRLSILLEACPNIY